jgi:hypothetical protein
MTARINLNCLLVQVNFDRYTAYYMHMILSGEETQKCLSRFKISIFTGFLIRILPVFLCHFKALSSYRIRMLLRQKDDPEDLRTRYSRRVKRVRDKINGLLNVIRLNTRSFMPTSLEITVN